MSQGVTQMSMNVAQVMVDTFEAAGARRCYGIVGDTVNRFAHAVHESPIDWIHVRHEEAGAFAAGAEAQMTGRLALCAGSCGPGSLHFINGLYEANRNRSPVVLVASQIARADLGFEFIQEVDFRDVFRGCSVFCEMILTPEQAQRKTVAACQAALSKRGVAVLIVPVDISSSACPVKLSYGVHVPESVIEPGARQLDEIAEILNASRAITIYAGAGSQGAHDEVVAAAARLQAPVAHTSRGKDFIEYDNPYNVGMTGIIGGAGGYQAILDCDVLLLLGTDFAWPQFYPGKAKIIQIDDNPTHLGRRHPVTIGALGDVKATLTALLPRLRQHDDSTFLDISVRRHRAETEKALAEKPRRDEMITGTYLAKLINRLAAQDAIFTADDGTATVWMLRHIDTGGKRRTFASLLHGTMASGVPSAIGLQASHAGRQVIALCGDGGFTMLMGDLLTLVQEDLPIKIAVFDNGKLGFVEIEQKAVGLEPLYTELRNPDFGAVAQAVGIWGRRVDSVSDLEDAVRLWLAQPGPALLHVDVAPMQLVTPPFIAGEAAAGMALYTARAVLHGHAGDVLEMIRENLP
jgi:pyruvate dehydrogenase (quinone)